MAKYANLSADEIRGHRMLVFRRTVAYIVLILVCIICIFPFVMLLVNTTKDTSTLKTTFSLLPGGDFVRNFTNAINETKVAVLHSMFNSLIVAVISCVTSVYIATLTAYGLYAYNFRLKKAAFVFIMVILMVPTQVSALGFVEMMDAWGIKDSFIPLIFPTLASPAVFFFIKQYMESSLPLEIVEAVELTVDMNFTSLTLSLCRF